MEKKANKLTQDEKYLKMSSEGFRKSINLKIKKKKLDLIETTRLKKLIIHNMAYEKAAICRDIEVSEFGAEHRFQKNKK